jgi:hypothetical protein
LECRWWCWSWNDLYVTHIACSLHDTKSVWKEVDLESPIGLTFWSPKSIHLLIYLKQWAFANPSYKKKEKTLLFQFTISAMCFEIPALTCKGLLLDALLTNVMAPFLTWLAKLCLRGSCMPPLADYKISQNAWKKSRISKPRKNIYEKMVQMTRSQVPCQT